jgi:hypothetical protein
MLLDQAVRQLVVLVKQAPPRLVTEARKLLRRVDNVGEQYGGENALNILHDDLAAAGDEFLDVAAERYDVALCPRPVIAGGILDVARARNVSREVAAVGNGDSYICFIVQDQDWQPELRQDGANGLRALRSDLIDPTIAVHHGRVVKRTGDGILIEFRSVVDAVRCAIEVQNGMAERNAGLPPERRIEFRVGIHLGDVVEESDGDLMGDGVNIAARLESIAAPGAICLSEDAYRQVKARLDLAVSDLGATQLKNIAEPVRVYSLEVGKPVQTKLPLASTAPRLSIVVLPFANLGGDPEQEYFVDGVTESLTTDLSRIKGSFVIARNTAFTYKGKPFDVKKIGHRPRPRRVVPANP